MSESAKLLSEAVNFAVIQLPGRRYPGVVVQGDTLNSQVTSLERMHACLARKDYDELWWEIENLRETLSGAMAFYKATCEKQAIEIPD
jgi:hypothetical protein